MGCAFLFKVTTITFHDAMINQEMIINLEAGCMVFGLGKQVSHFVSDKSMN